MIGTRQLSLQMSNTIILNVHDLCDVREIKEGDNPIRAADTHSGT
jgi:hypothetical protein